MINYIKVNPIQKGQFTMFLENKKDKVIQYKDKKFGFSIKKHKYTIYAIYIFMLFIIIAIATTHIYNALNIKATTHWQKGLHHWMENETQSAIYEWEKARLSVIFSRKEYPRYLYWLSRAYEKQNKKDIADKYKKKLTDTYPYTYYSLIAQPSYRELSRLKKTYLQNLYPTKWIDIVDKNAETYSIPQSIIYAIMKQESKFRHKAVSKSGAVGLMQLMPNTAYFRAKQTGLDTYNLYSPEDNIQIGTSYYRYLLKFTGGNTVTAIASYNAGCTSVSQWGDLNTNSMIEWVEKIPYIQTYHFVRNVLANYTMYERIYGNKSFEKKHTLRATMETTSFK